ncbi:TPA: tail fiber domain-containing protein, partial [Kluyvera cryocrescens]|uniref:tail fiber domain-containing protein n=1 Tax=Kluyvera cryocrescens TaxID=580 RepID=UPI00248B5E75|nr:tail fiber domain-containing protein [Kluyvera cryocrescens]HDG1674863.1 tail fiber domain-containing protein [Kluyvera cryocrescens]
MVSSNDSVISNSTTDCDRNSLCDAIIYVKQPFDGAIAENQHEINSKHVDAISAGAIGNGIADDTVAFNILESQTVYDVIDGLYKSYVVGFYPKSKTYINTTFIVEGEKIRGNGYFSGVARNSNVIIGDGAAPEIPPAPGNNGSGLVVIGEDALKEGRNNRYCIAIGERAMWGSSEGKFNIAMGLESLYYVNATGKGNEGTRNVMFGDNTGRFITNGYQNIGVGRNTAQAITSGSNNCAVGTNAMAGSGSMKFRDSQFIQNQTPFTGSGVTAIGSDSLYYCGGSDSSAIGYKSLFNAKSDAEDCTALGASTLSGLGSETSINGKVLIASGRVGEFAMTASQITFTLLSHGLQTGWEVIVSIPNPGTTYSDPQYYIITAINPDTFIVEELYALDGYSGEFTLISYATDQDQVTSERNTAVGAGAMYGVHYGSENVVVGVNSNAVNNGGGRNTAVGDVALRNVVGGNKNTAVGYMALSRMVDGTNATLLNNATGIGYNSCVSGDNQIQLGDANTTTYVFGTVHNRSDIRDKTDIRNTTLGIEFILGLRPVDGRWDMRDDYFEECEVQTGVDENGRTISELRLSPLPRDGSKKRQRFHHWFVAQEVSELCEKLGVEFGGYQDHKLAGGSDILSLGYDEFIPPLTKAVQDCWKRMDEIETRLTSLEKNNT